MNELDENICIRVNKALLSHIDIFNLLDYTVLALLMTVSI
jgi:hypothetical protein